MVPRGGAGHHARLPVGQSQAVGEPAPAGGGGGGRGFTCPWAYPCRNLRPPLGGAKVGMKEHITAMLSRTRRMPQALAHNLASLSAHVPGDLPAQHGDVQGLGVPAAQCVDHDGHKLQAFGLAPLLILPGIEVVGMLHRMCPIRGTPSDQGGLACVGAGEVHAVVLAVGPGVEEEVRGSVH